MVKNFFYLILFFISCKKETNDVFYFTLNSEYFNFNDNSYSFVVFGKNPFIPLDTIYWLKKYDSQNEFQEKRIVQYTIYDKKTGKTPKNYILNYKKLFVSSLDENIYLPIYKLNFLTEDTLRKYYERDSTGKHVRYFHSKLVEYKNNYFEGKCLYSYYYFISNFDKPNWDEILIKEYYAPKIGLVGIEEKFSKYENYTPINDSISFKYLLR